MASAFPVQSPGPENLEESFSDIRKRINSKFDWLHKNIEDRRQFLLARLAELESTHNKESKQQQTGLSSVLRVQSQVMEGLRENHLKHLQDSILDNIQTQIEQMMKISLKLNNVFFEFDDDKTRNFISSLGKLTKVPNYKAKKHPVIVSTAKHTSFVYVPGELRAPKILCVEPNSGNIYIGCYFGVVHIFSPNAEFIRIIDSKTPNYCVSGLAFNGENIFITSTCTFIRQYHLNGTYIREIQMPKRLGHAISMTILSNDLFIATQYGYPMGVMDLDSMIIKPVNLEKIVCNGSSVDMRSTPQGDLAILYKKTPFVVVYNVRGSMLAQPFRESVHLESPEYFTIDSCGNFIISDSYIKIFQSNGDLLHIIGGPSNPGLITFALGIDIDSQGRIVSICGKQTDCLQIF